MLRRRDLIREEMGGINDMKGQLPEQMRKIIDVESKYIQKWRFKYDEALNRYAAIRKFMIISPIR